MGQEFSRPETILVCRMQWLFLAAGWLLISGTSARLGIAALCPSHTSTNPAHNLPKTKLSCSLFLHPCLPPLPALASSQPREFNALQLNRQHQVTGRLPGASSTKKSKTVFSRGSEFGTERRRVNNSNHGVIITIKETQHEKAKATLLKGLRKADKGREALPGRNEQRCRSRSALYCSPQAERATGTRLPQARRCHFTEEKSGAQRG